MRIINTVITTFLLGCLAVTSTWAHAADFTWRGQLADGGEPANGSYDLSVAVYADEGGETALGGAIEFGAVSVAGGTFALALPLDDAIGLDQVWLEVSVRDAGDSGAFETLAQRQRVDLQPAAVCPASWEIAGNAGLGPANFLGTTDEKALRVRVGNRLAMRVLPSNNLATNGDAPNLILGSSANAIVGTGVEGATISGGGSSRAGGGACSFCDNRVSDDFASVGGGVANHANGFRSRVGGGGGNTADGDDATIGGGLNNQAAGDLGTVSGGNFNFASGRLSAIPGGDGNVAGGDYSFAAGRVAHVRDASEAGDFNGDEGTFVWSDSTTVFPSSFSSTGPNQFLINANGGVGVNSASIPGPIDMVLANRSAAGSNVDLYLRTRAHARGINIAMIPGTGAAAMRIAQYNGASFTDRIFLEPNGDFSVTAAAFKPGGGSWTASSDIRLKKNVSGLDGALDRLLALHGVSFEYADPDPARRPPGQLMGFVAQQVEPLFPNWIGHDAEGYLTVGTQGFEALTVEAMRELRGEKDRGIAALRSDNQTLADKLRANEALTAELQARLDTFRVEQELLAARLDALDEPPPTPPEQRIAGAGSR